MLSSLSLKTRLLFMMVLLCFLSIALLLILYARAEREFLREVKRHTEELSTAIQVSLEQINQSYEDIDSSKLKNLTYQNKKGIKEISVLDDEGEIIASSNPGLIGKKLPVKGERITNINKLTENITALDSQKRYDILLPVVMGGESLGYIHIAMQFEDFKYLIKSNNRNRLLATLVIFAIGILAAVYLSNRYTKPILNLALAAQKVAGGDLTVRLNVRGEDEIGRLTENFNNMVKKLNENRELESKLKEAEHMSKIGQLASGIAHEIRNPLNLINLSIDYLRSIFTPVQNKENFEKTIASIKSEIQRLDSMIENFLNFGKPLNLKPQKIALDSIIQETAALLEEKCREQRITMEIRHTSYPQEITADFRQIKTCLMNVLLNAIQSMPHGGRLLVESGKDNGYVSLKVEDTGCGIQPEHLSKIFEPYFTTKDAGIGLGLALTKRIIEEHGGRISVDSSLKKGTSVTIDLPVIVEA
ncbi:MAG: ATP-binding protein [Nitrospinota bacterium]